MAIQDIIERLKGMRKDEQQKDDIPDDVTRDKHLRSLRRMDRKQNEEIEKEELIQKIADFNLARTRKHLFGIKEGLEKKVADKKFEILKSEVNILKEKKINQKSAFFGKHDI